MSLVGLAACGDASSAPAAGAEPVAVVDDTGGGGESAAGPVITALESEAGADGPIDGVLVLRDGCLLVDNGPEFGASLALLPFGTTWDAAASAIVHPSGQSVAVGSVLSGTGEGHPVQDVVPWFATATEQDRLQACVRATGIADVLVIGWFEPGTPRPSSDVTTTQPRTSVGPGG